MVMKFSPNRDITNHKISARWDKDRISLSDLRWGGISIIPAKSVERFLWPGCRIFKVPKNTPNRFSQRALGIFSTEKIIWTNNIFSSWRNLKMQKF